MTATVRVTLPLARVLASKTPSSSGKPCCHHMGKVASVGTPVRGGATLREAHLAMEIIHDTGAMRAMDLVEINPILDSRNATAELAAELIASAFGRRIL